MAKFLLRRLLNYVVLVAIAASLAYFLAAASLKPRSNFEGRSPRPPQNVIEQQLDELNLNDKTPIFKRYETWVTGVLHGDFGKTWDGDSVNEEMGRRIGVSLRLLLIGTILGGVLGVALGALGAIKQYRLTDRFTTFGAFLVMSIPIVVLAVLLQVGAQWVNNRTGVRLFQWTGEYDPGETGGFFGNIGSRFQHLVLPTITIALVQIATYSRYQRSMMLDVLGADFVRTAMAKGLRRRTALTRHALRTAVIPVVTFFAYGFTTLLAGATFTEKIFGWHGMGEWLIDSINRNDVNAVAAYNCFAAVLVLCAGLLSDVAYAVLDPRVRV